VAAPTIYVSSDGWKLSLELAICRKAALAIRQVCYMADLVSLEQVSPLAARVLAAVTPIYELVKSELGPDDSSDMEVYGCIEVVRGWLGG